MGMLFPLLLLAMGAYVLVGAIKGTGRLFSTENFKEESKDKAKKIMRAIYFALAAFMLIMALVNFGQTTLFSTKLTYYRVTDAYRETFYDLLENGKLTYTTTQSSSSGMSCFGGATTGTEVTYGPYDVNDQKMEIEEISAFINKAYAVYGTDQTKFPTTSGGGLLSCMGGSVDYAKYYEQTDLIKVVNGEDVPVYGTDDPDAHVVYVSSYGNVRSDANDGSFWSGLYGFLSPKLLTILNYVFLGLAVVGLVLLFVTTSKATDKEKLKKARAQQVQGRSSMPSGAFNFDDDEKSEK